MLVLHDPNNDILKNKYAILRNQKLNRTCTAPNCNNILTSYKGPGSQRLCREHQLTLREYGGLARMDRPWTFSRKWTCDWCGYNPKEDSFFDNPPIPFESELHKIQVQRTTLVGDHIERNIDGGSHCENNVQTLCQNCNAKKTSLYKDFRIRDKKCVKSATPKTKVKKTTKKVLT